MTGEIDVNLLDGTYELASTWTFGPSDSGSNGFPVVWQAAPNAHPTISGGRRITGWTQNADGTFQASAPGFNTRHLYVDGVRMPRAGGGLTASHVTRSLDPSGSPDLRGFDADNGNMLSWRNPANIEFEFSGLATSPIGQTPDTSTRWRWTDPRCPVKAISRTANGAFIEMAQPCFGNLMAYSGIPFFQLGPYGTGGFFLPPTLPTRVENAYELLDEPGEWYLDVSTATLYYRPQPGQNMLSATVVVPVLETLMNVAGTPASHVHNIQFKGLTFAYATWLRPGTPVGFRDMQANFTQTSTGPNGIGDARQGGDATMGLAGPHPFGGWTRMPDNVSVSGSDHILFETDIFTHLGASALGFQNGSSSDAVTNCAFTDVSGSGIQIGDTNDPNPTDARATVNGTSVTGNYIHDLPVEYLGGVGIFVGYTRDVVVSSNQINNMPYSGMSIGWGGWGLPFDGKDPNKLLANASRRNIVAHNNIFDVLQVLDDGGPLYSSGYRGTTTVTSPAFDGDTYDGNHLHDLWHPTGYPLYDDAGSAYVRAQRQVLYGRGVYGNWGGCHAAGPLDFSGGFWLPGDPLFGSSDPAAPLAFSCASGPLNGPVTSSGNTTLNVSAACEADPACASLTAAVACENNPACASIVANAGIVADRVGETVMVDDEDPGVAYAGSWSGRDTQLGLNVRGTRRYTLTDGDSVSVPFAGTGVDIITDADTNRGTIAISVDGVARQNANCATAMLVPNYVCARVRGLSGGSHTLKITKTGGAVLSFDAARVYASGAPGKSLDDPDASVQYAGASWASATRSGYAEFNSTIHYATTNGDCYTVSFTGTGLDLFGGRDSGRGQVDVSVDGAFKETVDASTSLAFSSQQRLFSVRDLTQGAHTVKGCKRSGSFMDLDRVDVFGTTTVNDTDPSIQYGHPALWTAQSGTAANFNSDVHYTSTDGETATLTFVGSGVDMYTVTSTDRGVVDVTLDGLSRGRIFTYSASRVSQAPVLRIHSLPRGTHTLTVTKRSGAFMAIDRFDVLDK